jgi:hypothetical protein
MKRDKIVFDLIEKEKQRQEHGVSTSDEGSRLCAYK